MRIVGAGPVLGRLRHREVQAEKRAPARMVVPDPGREGGRQVFLPDHLEEALLRLDVGDHRLRRFEPRASPSSTPVALLPRTRMRFTPRRSHHARRPRRGAGRQRASARRSRSAEFRSGRAVNKTRLSPGAVRRARTIRVNGRWNAKPRASPRIAARAHRQRCPYRPAPASGATAAASNRVAVGPSIATSGPSWCASLPSRPSTKPASFPSRSTTRAAPGSAAPDCQQPPRGWRRTRARRVPGCPASPPLEGAPQC